MKQRLENIDFLVWMKLWAAIILGICSYWIFSDREVNFDTYSLMYLPWIYFYYTDLYITKKFVVLLIPVLMNIALWVPCYRSYLFIRIVLYVERIASIFWALLIFGSLWIILLAHGSATHLLFISGMCIAFNELMLVEVKTEKFKENFSATLNLKTEKEITLLIRKLGVVFYITIFLLLSGENLLQKTLPANYLQVETRNYIKLVKENKVEEIPYSDGLQTKLSRDEKMLLVKIPSYKEEGNNKNMFVVNFASMETINILPSSNSTTKNFNNNDYEFTPDNKYVVVGNRVLENPRIKFAVLDIATGKVDPRFHDPKGLLENLPQDIEEVPLIRFNPSGDYFVVISRVKYPDYRLEFWDYKQGILVYVEEIKGKIKEATWSSERKFLFLGDYNFYNEKNTTNKGIDFVEQREILANGSVLSIGKEKITADIQIGDWSRKKRNFITSDDSGKYISILNTSFNDNNLEIWEADSEDKIFSLASDNKIKSILFHPDGKQLIVFELLRDERIRITFWDIATKKQQQRFFIQSSLKGNTISLFDRSTTLFFKNSNKVLLTGESVDIISLKNL